MRSLTPLSEAIGPTGDIKTGPFGTVLQASEYSNSGVPMLSVGEIRDGFIAVTDKTPRIGKETRERLPEFVLLEGEVVFARKGGIERTAYIGPREDGWFLGSDALRVRTGPRLDGRFLSFQLRTERIQTWLAAHATGSTMPSLNQSIIGRIPIWTPALNEQQAIAEVLGALDDKIVANKALVSASEALMVTLVSDLPSNAVLSDLAAQSRNQVSVDTMTTRQTEHHSLPAFDQHRLPALEPAGTIQSSKFAVVAPSVLLSKLNPRFPRVWNVPHPGDSAVASTEFVVLSPHTFSTSSLWAILARPATTAFLAERVTGTSGSHQRVRPDEIMQMPVPGPDQISDHLDSTLEHLGLLVHEAVHESRSLAELRDTLLPALLDGTLRVKDAVRHAEAAL
ncbi:restriction endonuclease subunit S [Propionibacteriaceae bacterium Y1923]